MKEVKKGQWYALCCEQDLEKAEYDFIDDEDLYVGPWETKKEALEALYENGGDQRECKRMLKELGVKD